ncbi:H(+)-transporting V0 sector ATPase subunit c [Trichoglossum hirsutum]|uniref:H(+)-transporting V0 sector ATPase subunit c n=1 Tax=Trichoglossum hirsutum TaxID=265104 RepID=A0A9P8LHD9_9PEZI|nr:H(+)-transporting V0 sector ATPase subunit c [Trichoglossum hirsutum]
MAGIIGIYGLVVSVLISDGLKQKLPLYTGFIQLGAGLSVGLAGLAAGAVRAYRGVVDELKGLHWGYM